VVEYGLAPTYQYPTQLEQAFQAYKWLLQQRNIHASNVIVAGDSAGGNLCIALLLSLLEASRGKTTNAIAPLDDGDNDGDVVPLPAGGILISPWVNLTSTSSLQKFVRDNDNNLASRFVRDFCGECNPSDPLVSPVFADVRGLPPLLITAGSKEELFEDINKFYKNCCEVGVQASMVIGENMPHVYQILYQGMHPEVEHGLQRMREFLVQFNTGKE